MYETKTLNKAIRNANATNKAMATFVVALNAGTLSEARASALLGFWFGTGDYAGKRPKPAPGVAPAKNASDAERRRVIVESITRGYDPTQVDDSEVSAS